ncbi:MAG: hypothetical protein WCE38_11185 [Burkholderiales bacterium]
MSDAKRDKPRDNPDPGSSDKLSDKLPDRMKGPGGMTLRQIHEQVKKSVERDRAAQRVHNPLVQPQNRWQRLVRYVWGRSGRR